MIGFVVLAALTAAADPFPPTLVAPPPSPTSLGAALACLQGQGGVVARAVDFSLQMPCPTRLGRQPVWAALEDVARAVNGRLVLAQHGRQVNLAPLGNRPPTPSAVAGAFRVAVRQVASRVDFDTGGRFTDVTLDLHWEPRLTVFRVDAQPAIESVSDDRASKLVVTTAKARTPPTGSVHTTTVRVPDVPRSATKITQLAGTFTVTATDRYLNLRFPELPVGKPASQEQAGVRVTVHPPRKLDDVVEVRVVLDYPEAHPAFESFESWTAGNRLRLVSPGGKPVEPTDYATQEAGRRAVCEYRFPAAAVGDLKGWSLAYDTPAPLREFPVRFALTDIPLP
ncbi:MAG: hypothetical protein U0871_03040 [Gemmataceae bacterium]